MEKIRRYIISGGGTGGHIFPAIAIANGLRAQDPNADILFIGAKGKMEMEKVPKAGYKIEGLNVQGLKRGSKIKNIPVLLKFGFAVLKSCVVIRRFKPDIAIGVGGYASGAMMKAADIMGVKILIQEQNSLPGKTNKMIASKAEKICVAYDGMEKYFNIDKIIKTGNPIRKDIIDVKKKQDDAFKVFNINNDKPVVLIVGGSQGALSINRAIYAIIDQLESLNVNIIWQTGPLFYKDAIKVIEERDIHNIQCYDFIYDMRSAYSVADIAVSRAGAIALSEFCVVGLPAILIPLPTAAENHQMVNALSIEKENAAIVIKDENIKTELLKTLTGLILNQEKINKMSDNMKRLAVKDSVERIVREINKVVADND